MVDTVKYPVVAAKYVLVLLVAVVAVVDPHVPLFVPLLPKLILLADKLFPAAMDAVAVPDILSNLVTEVPDAIDLTSDLDNVRLLYEATYTVCVVPLYSTVPVPEVKVPFGTVSEPPIFIVPPLVMVRLPSLRPELPKVTDPETVNIEPLLNCSVPVPFPVPALMETLAHVAVDTSTVTVTPLGIITASVDAGTPDGDQVAAVFQFPVLAVFCAKVFATKSRLIIINSDTDLLEMLKIVFIKI